MVLKFALLSSLWFASAALAVPSQQEASLARRDDYDSEFQPQPLDNIQWSVDAASGDLMGYSYTWGGAFWLQPFNTISDVTATFIIPLITDVVPRGAVSMWSGIDGGPECNGVSVKAGVLLVVNRQGVLEYKAWCEWYPGNFRFLNLEIGSGDVIRIVIHAFSPYSATLNVENLSRANASGVRLNSAHGLCMARAQWIVENPRFYGQVAHLLNFVSVTYVNAKATGFGNPGIEYTPYGAELVDMLQDRQRTYASVSAIDRSLTVTYLA